MIPSMEAIQLDPSEYLSTLVRRADGYGERLGEFRRNAACARQMVEGLVLVEPRHFNGPFDHRAVAADFEAVMSPGNRNDASIKIRGETTVDGQFFLASLFAFLDR